MSDNLLDLFQTTNESHSISTNTNTNINTNTSGIINDTNQVLTKEEIIKILKKLDNSGLGVLTLDQCLHAMREIPNLGMTQAEYEECVRLATEICGDGNDKIKIEEFAMHLTFEIKKKQKAAKHSQRPEQNSQHIKIPTGLQINTDSTGIDNIITKSPSPRTGDVVLTPTDPTAAFTVPEWYGRSLHSPAVGNDGNTGDIETLKKSTSQSTPTPNKMQVSPINIGLIAPPRSKDQKSPRTPEKKKTTPSTRPASTLFSFAVHFSDGANPVVETPAIKPKTHDDKEEKNTNFDLVEPPSESIIPNVDTKQSSSSSQSNNSSENERKEVNNKAKDKDNDTETQTEPESGKTEEKKRSRTDALEVMRRGTAMLKYGRRGLPHFRRFQVSEDLTRLLWYSHKKNLEDTSIAIADIKEVLEGQQTEVFKQCTQVSLERASFSIVYGNKSKTLDLVAKSYEEAKLWSKGLRGLIKAHKQGKLHKVSQIMVNVEYTDITKPNYRSEENSQIIAAEFNDEAAVQLIQTTLEQSKKTYKAIQELMRDTGLQKNKEYTSLKETMSDLEERFDYVTFALTHKTMPLMNLKRDIWILKVDVTVLHEKAQVLGKTGFRLF